ncbi:membrane protein [Halorhabdus tiamatea SARL4B]|uniref:Membrane protein n=1 Tax=Halorhabdus tiamatea SARL4B TaxID=1033806 RepID=F7PFK6_9EURY|nr:helix-turn-helix domain-containing protein [Halorhabdus tiamatea]ERJ06427.1 membrane protein [Halorhabdus tiamatea SARL4B]CCQ34334.1 transcriptional regulator-like protein [Halorhabdus tiamatea SARL4B]
MSERAAAVVSLLVIVGLTAPIVIASGSLGVESGEVDAATENVAVPESGPDANSRDDPLATESPLAIGDDRFDRTLFEITVYENRSARWRFQFTQQLNDTNEADFDAYAAEFRENETELYRGFVASAQELTRTGTNVTGREMNATKFSRDAYTGSFDNLGVVEMSFVWTNFAEPRNGGSVVGDVFEGGLAINADQRLRIVAGPSLTIDGDSVDPLPSNTTAGTLTGADAVEWVGEYVFADQRPRVAFDPVAAETTTATSAVTTTAGAEEQPTDRTTSEHTGTTTSSNATTDGPDADTDGTTVAADGMGGIGVDWMVVGLVAITLVVVIGTWRLGYFDVGEESGGSAGDAGTDDGGSGDGGAAADAGGSAVTDAALVSDDDRVRQLLEDNGGRMKQTEIVEATQWSKSKVSMLLSEMEDEGKVTKLRVGRENIVSLPGSEPEAARSPFEDLDDEK